MFDQDQPAQGLEWTAAWNLDCSGRRPEFELDYNVSVVG